MRCVSGIVISHSCRVLGGVSCVISHSCRLRGGASAGVVCLICHILE